MRRLSNKYLSLNHLAVIVVAMLLFLSSCEERITSPIPYAPVNIKLELDFRDRDLIPSLATKSFTHKRDESDRLGFGGVLVINGININGGLVNLYAFDLACPVEADRNVKVVPDDAGRAICPQCGAVYVIASGTGVAESGSQYPLRSYRISSAGGDKYLVSN